jgi:hypothetical protein
VELERFDHPETTNNQLARGAAQVVERDLGRPPTEQEEFLVLEQARALGMGHSLTPLPAQRDAASDASPPPSRLTRRRRAWLRG